MHSTRSYIQAAGLLLTLAPLAGCLSPDDDACEGPEDCFRDQYCVEGTCQDDPPVVIENNGSNSSANNSSGNNSSGNNSTGNNSTGNNGSTNNTSSNNSSGNTSANNSTGNNSSGNNASGNNGSTGGVCQRNPFDMPSCEQSEDDKKDESNDSYSDYTSLSPSGGCIRSTADSYTAITERVISRTLCHWETADWYNQYIYSCDSRSFTATFELQPRDACLPEEVQFEIRDVFSPETWQEDCAADDLMQCERLDNGGWRVQLLFPSSDSGNARSRVGFRVGVYGVTHAQFPYDLTITLPELQ